jgi:hypothetical protein
LIRVKARLRRQALIGRLETGATAMGVDAKEVAVVTAEDVREICGDILDWKLAAILALRPTGADLTAAVGWAGGEDELGQQGHPLTGVAATLYDVLRSDEDYGEER